MMNYTLSPACLKPVSVFIFTMLCCSSAAQRLPKGPDPDECYVRVIAPYSYAVFQDSVLTYTEEEAALYPFTTVRYVTRPGYGRWESVYLEDCESADADDCQVLCYRTYPEESVLFFEPMDTSLGEPIWERFEIKELISKGGLAAYEVVDCQLRSYQELPVEYVPGSPELTEGAREVLHVRLVEFLRDRPNLRVQISTHTGSPGSTDDNRLLSNQWAAAIGDYLVSEGIERERLVMRGYGEARLKNHCADGVDCTEAEHALNRRVEFKVLSIEAGSSATSGRKKKKRRRRSGRN